LCIRGDWSRPTRCATIETAPRRRSNGFANSRCTSPRAHASSTPTSATSFWPRWFTGTVFWIDPKLDLFLVFLSNRVHPDGKGAVNPLAGKIATLAASAIDDPAGLERYECFVQGLVDAGDVETEAVMRRVAKFYEGEK
jgi:CubicO group peptidase (beta-lactamase class C family)